MSNDASYVCAIALDVCRVTDVTLLSAKVKRALTQAIRNCVLLTRASAKMANRAV